MLQADLRQRYGWRYFFLPPRRVDHGEDFVLAHDQVLLAVELDFLSGILAEQNAIARL